mgnify:CR=1 FL=1
MSLKDLVFWLTQLSTYIKAGIPLMFTTCPEDIAEFSENEDIYPVKIYVKPLWEK